MELYHFSHESDIKVFIPRVKANRTDMPPVVWAIDPEHAFTFYVPRNCPRIVYKRSAAMSEEDEQIFFGVSSSDTVMVMENDWYSQISQTTMYRYTFAREGFERFDETAGYFITQQTVRPLDMQPISQLLDQLMALNIEVRFTPRLTKLREAILASTLTDFGIHRFEHAKRV